MKNKYLLITFFILICLLTLANMWNYHNLNVANALIIKYKQDLLNVEEVEQAAMIYDFDKETKFLGDSVNSNFLISDLIHNSGALLFINIDGCNSCILNAFEHFKAISYEKKIIIECRTYGQYCSMKKLLKTDKENEQFFWIQQTEHHINYNCRIQMFNHDKLYGSFIPLLSNESRTQRYIENINKFIRNSCSGQCSCGHIHSAN